SGAARGARGGGVLAPVESGAVAARPDEGLDAREEDGAALPCVAVREGERAGVPLSGAGQLVVGAARRAEEGGHVVTLPWYVGADTPRLGREVRCVTRPVKCCAACAIGTWRAPRKWAVCAPCRRISWTHRFVVRYR